MSLILPILVFLVFYFFIIKPKQAKLKAAQAEQAQITTGDRVLTRSGIYGRVARVSVDLAVVEVSPGLELVFDRRSVLKAPESVNVDEQLTDTPFANEFSDEDFTELHDHLESHSEPIHPDVESDPSHDTAPPVVDETEIRKSETDGHGSEDQR